jgi:hypothetical protein
MNTDDSRDQRYLKLVVDRIEVCKSYRPQFGQGKSVSRSEFKSLYGADPFYTWFGLNTPLLYAAHKAAGGITSLYRQIGTGCEQLFRQIICDRFQLTPAQATWSYVVESSGGKPRTLSLDARIQIDEIVLQAQRHSIEEWMRRAAYEMGADTAIARALKGAVFEVRQGYKSKDSKRQNADITNAGTAYQRGYLPVVAVLSTQIDEDVANRYRNAGWLLLRGSLGESSLSSTYAFCKQVLGYDLAGFFERHSLTLKRTIEQTLAILLAPDDQPNRSNQPEVESDLDHDDEFNAPDEDEA